MNTSRSRTMVAYVEDRPGVLNRIASLFRRRGYNISSLNVGRTHEPGVSRMTLVVDCDDDTAKRLEANLYKLVDVISVSDITTAQSVVRDLLLIKVRATSANRTQILAEAENSRAHVVDIDDESVVLEMTGRPERVQHLVEALAPHGIIEMVTTGAIAMTRGPAGAAVQVAHRNRDESAA